VGDLVGAGGQVEMSGVRVRCARAEFRGLAPVLTSQDASLG